MSGKPIDEAVVTDALISDLLPAALIFAENEEHLDHARQRAKTILLETLTAAQQQGQAVAEAWQEGYRQGVLDERTSEDNIGIAGFGAKVEPARNNPYALAQQPAAVSADGLQKLAAKWLFDDGYLTGDPKIDDPTIHRRAAKRECAQELIEHLAAQHQEPKS